MHRHFKLATVAAATLLAASAFAESPTIANDPVSSGATRAQVQAELAAYRQAGLNPWSISYDPLRGLQPGATREGLAADYVASREQVRALTGEDSGSAWLAGHRAAAAPSTLAALPTRAN